MAPARKSYHGHGTAWFRFSGSGARIRGAIFQSRGLVDALVLSTILSNPRLLAGN